MKLHKIEIKAYRILQEFVLDLGEETHDTQNYTLHLIVGVNGTGKSTLLRLLAKLFLQLRHNENNRNPPFGFKVSYQLSTGGDLISITNLDEDDNVLRGNTGLRISYKKQDQQEDDNYRPFNTTRDADNFPRRIVVLTTGSEHEWINEFHNAYQTEDDDLTSLLPNPGQAGFQERLKDWYLQELPGLPIANSGEDTALSDTFSTPLTGPILNDYLYFINTEQLPLITLCGMLVDMYDAVQTAVTEPVEEHSDSAGTRAHPYWKNLQTVMKMAEIKALRGFSLRFRLYQDTLTVPDKRFIEGLRKLAHHTVQRGSDCLIVFHLPEQAHTRKELLQALLDMYGTGFLLFSRLALMAQTQGREKPLLREVNLFLERSTHPSSLSEQGTHAPLHLFQWLSDGERSFLGRLCLMPLLRDSEALVLLDEPEVHFNDYWKRQLVLLLDTSFAPVETTRQRPLQPCHVIMTTHSSITLTDVFNRNILVLHRHNGYTSRAETLNLETLGADPSDLMVSVFGAERASGARGIHYIEQSLNAISYDGKAQSEQIREQQKATLKDLLGRVGPGYWRFAIRRKLHELEGEK